MLVVAVVLVVVVVRNPGEPRARAAAFEPGAMHSWMGHPAQIQNCQLNDVRDIGNIKDAVTNWLIHLKLAACS